ncbi:hypothetical protein [Streptomyces sp. NPDC053079]
MCGTIAFVTGCILLILGQPGSTELLSTAAAAWGLAAAMGGSSH